MLAKLSQDVVRDFGLLWIRAILGTVLVFHGGQKLFGWWDGPGLAGFAAYLEQLQIPLPAYGAVLAGTAEFFGGLAILIGFSMRWMLVPVIATMAVAIAYVHPKTFSIQASGMEYALTLACVAAGLLLTGPGRFACTRLPAIPWARQPHVLNLTSEPKPFVSRGHDLGRGEATLERVR